MAISGDLPCDGDGVCMVCKVSPPETELIPCCTCATPWHAPCLSRPLESLASLSAWKCPDCSSAPSDAGAAAPVGGSGGLIASIRAIEADRTLTEHEKARRRQELVGGKSAEEGKGGSEVPDVMDEKFSCSFCMRLPERPVTTPCGHNFCLKCFQKWIGQGKHTCAKCRAPIPPKMASQPRINSALVVAIRMARAAQSTTSGGQPRVYHVVRNDNRPEKAFTTERAKKAGKANACSGQIFVNVPSDHLGPILAEHDPKRNQGVLVGEMWEDRLECRQWGVHLPHVAGIAGQSDYGAQSVALSGGYEDDEDHGDWFLYTGSGGRDLSGNKRTNKEHAFDQKFEKCNEALRVSCKMGYPVRVVRSHKEKRSSYAPESGVRYDGIYRIEKCWRKVGTQGFKVCRYLFVRCDNEPAPWTSDEQGDRPRPLPDVEELKAATDITVRKERAAWDYIEKCGWTWTRPPPESRKAMSSGNPEGTRRIRPSGKYTKRKRVPKELSCQLCSKLMSFPLTTPCAHNFCKPCLLGSYSDQSFVRERTCGGGRTLRARKIVKQCPSCPNDISDFLQNPQVNRELMDLIASIREKTDGEDPGSAAEGSDGALVKSDEAGNVIEDKTSSSDGSGSIEEESDGVKMIPWNEKASDDPQEEKVKALDKDLEVNTEKSETEDSDKENKSVDNRTARASEKRMGDFAGENTSKKTCQSKDQDVEP